MQTATCTQLQQTDVIVSTAIGFFIIERHGNFVQINFPGITAPADKEQVAQELMALDVVKSFTPNHDFIFVQSAPMVDARGSSLGFEHCDELTRQIVRMLLHLYEGEVHTMFVQRHQIVTLHSDQFPKALKTFLANGCIYVEVRLDATMSDIESIMKHINDNVTGIEIVDLSSRSPSLSPYFIQVFPLPNEMPLIIKLGVERTLA